MTEPANRRSIAVIGSHGWIEIYEEKPGRFLVEHHYPTKAPGGGITDRPEEVVTGDWRGAVRILLAKEKADADELIGRLDARWRDG